MSDREENAAGTFNLSGWFGPMVWTLVGICFPIALVMAWALEVTPEGVQVDTDGSAHFSEELTVEQGVTDAGLLDPYPSPVHIWIPPVMEQLHNAGTARSDFSLALRLVEGDVNDHPCEPGGEPSDGTVRGGMFLSILVTPEL